MRHPKTSLFNVKVHNAFGTFYVVVDTVADLALRDAREIGRSVAGSSHITMVKTEGQPVKISRHSLASYDPVPNAKSGDSYWAWYRKA